MQGNQEKPYPNLRKKNPLDQGSEARFKQDLPSKQGAQQLRSKVPYLIRVENLVVAKQGEQQ